jgi:hypothetical protein
LRQYFLQRSYYKPSRVRRVQGTSYPVFIFQISDMKKVTLLLALCAFATASFAQTAPTQATPTQTTPAQTTPAQTAPTQTTTTETEVKVRDNGTEKVVTKTGKTNVGQALDNTADAAGNVAKKAGTGIKRGAKKTGTVVKRGVKKTGTAVKRGSQKISSKAKEGTQKAEAKTE